MLVCRNCQNRMQENMRFCTVCGTKLTVNCRLEAPEIIQNLSKRLGISTILYVIGGCWLICISILTKIAGYDGIAGLGSLILYIVLGLFSFLMALNVSEDKKRILKDYSGIVKVDEDLVGDSEFCMGFIMIILVIGVSLFLFLFGGWTSILIMFSAVFYLIDFLYVNSYVKKNKSEFLLLEQRQNEDDKIKFCSSCGAECMEEDEVCSQCGYKIGRLKDEM